MLVYVGIGLDDNVISPTEDRCPGGVFNSTTVETVVPTQGQTLEVLE